MVLKTNLQNARDDILYTSVKTASEKHNFQEDYGPENIIKHTHIPIILLPKKYIKVPVLIFQIIMVLKTNLQNARDDILYTSVKTASEKHNFQEDYGPAPVIGTRHFQCVLFFLLIFFGYGIRVIISVGIVAMTDPKTSINPDIPTYPEWDQKGAILSAFFWGYLWPQIFAGYLTNRFGAKWFLITCMCIQSLLSIAVPFIAAYFGPYGLIAARVIQGFCQGLFIPMVTQLLSQWVPHEERATLSNIVFGAVPLGTVVTLLTTGMIAASWYGWPMVFYMYGSLGMIWCVAFSIWGYDSPATHPTIGNAEKYYIEYSLGHTDEKPHCKIPTKSLIKSIPVWALLITQCGYIFGFWVILSQIPTYMNFVMNFNIKDNSLLSSIPYMISFLLSVAVSSISDYVINKGFINQTTSRKLFNTIGAVIPAAALILLAYTKSSESTRAVILLITAVGGASFGNVGWGLNHMDLTPNHSGTLMGICNSIAHISAIIAPLLVQLLINDERDSEQWKSVFFITSFCYGFTAIIFVLFGSADVQPWNEDQDENEDQEKNT